MTCLCEIYGQFDINFPWRFLVPSASSYSEVDVTFHVPWLRGSLGIENVEIQNLVVDGYSTKSLLISMWKCMNMYLFLRYVTLFHKVKSKILLEIMR